MALAASTSTAPCEAAASVLWARPSSSWFTAEPERGSLIYNEGCQSLVIEVYAHGVPERMWQHRMLRCGADSRLTGPPWRGSRWSPRSQREQRWSQSERRSYDSRSVYGRVPVCIRRCTHWPAGRVALDMLEVVGVGGVGKVEGLR